MDRGYQDQMRMFALLWATSILFQLASVLWFANQITHSPPTLAGLLELAVLLTCLAVVWSPTRKWILALAALELVDFGMSLPHMPNHRLITAGMSFGILLAFGSAAVKKPSAENPPFANFASVGRLSLIIVYAYAVFHKLNADFVRVDTSCATVFYGHVGRTLPFLPESNLVLQALPYLTLLTEAAIPLLLLSSRTRFLGIWTALFFHSLLAFDVEKHFFDFSSTIFALLSLYLPLSFLDNLRGSLRSRPYLGLQLWRRLFTLLYLSVTFASLFSSNRFGFYVFFGGRQILWWLLNALYVFLFYLGTRKVVWEDAPLLPRRLLTLLLPALFVINGLCPYLGIKTRSSFDMYSNLRVEGGRSNHFLIRRPLDLFGHMHELYQLRESPDPFLRAELLEPGLLITGFELRRYLSRNPNTPISYSVGDEVRILARASDEEALVKKQSFIEEKILWYRPVDPRPHANCQW